jgi:hypothetical protein
MVTLRIQVMPGAFGGSPPHHNRRSPRVKQIPKELNPSVIIFINNFEIFAYAKPIK